MYHADCPYCGESMADIQTAFEYLTDGEVAVIECEHCGKFSDARISITINVYEKPCINPTEKQFTRSESEK